MKFNKLREVAKMVDLFFKRNNKNNELKPKKILTFLLPFHSCSRHMIVVQRTAAMQIPHRIVAVSNQVVVTRVRLPIVAGSISWNHRCATIRSGSAAKIRNFSVHFVCTEPSRKCTLAGIWSVCIRIMRPCWRQLPLQLWPQQQLLPRASNVKRKTRRIAIQHLKKINDQLVHGGKQRKRFTHTHTHTLTHKHVQNLNNLQLHAM